MQHNIPQEKLKTLVSKRIRLLRMDDDPNPIAVGDLGYVTNVNGIGKPWCQVTVNWDSGRTLRLLYPQDNFVIVE